MPNYFLDTYHQEETPNTGNYFIDKYHKEEPKTEKPKSWTDLGKSLVPDWATNLATKYSEMPSWLEQASAEAKKSAEAYKIGGVPALMANTQPTQALAAGFVPIQAPIKYAGPASAEKLLEVGGKQIDAARNSGLTFVPEAGANAANYVTGNLPPGLTVRRAPQTFGEINELPKLGETNTPIDFRDIHDVRQGLHGVQRGTARSTTDTAATDEMASTLAKRSLDNWLENAPPNLVLKGNPQEVSSTLREGNLNYSAGKAAQDLDKRLYRAELSAAPVASGLNVESKVRGVAAKLLTSPEIRTFTPEAKKQADIVARGTQPENKLRYMSNLLGGGGGLGALLTGAAGYALGGDIGTAGMGAGIGAIGAPLLGYIAKQGATGLALSHLNRLSELLREPAPLSQATKDVLVDPNQYSLAARQALIRALLTNQPNTQQQP